MTGEAPVSETRLARRGGILSLALVVPSADTGGAAIAGAFGVIVMFGSLWFTLDAVARAVHLSQLVSPRKMRAGTITPIN